MVIGGRRSSLRVCSTLQGTLFLFTYLPSSGSLFFYDLANLLAEVEKCICYHVEQFQEVNLDVCTNDFNAWLATYKAPIKQAS